MSTATEILPAGASETDYPAWLTARRAGVSSSDIMAILGLLPYRSAYEVWLDKTGRLPLKRDNHLMERGRRLEPAAAQWLSDRTGLTLRRTGTWRNTARPWMLANPDRFVAGEPAGAEFKVVDADWSGSWESGPALFAQGQAQWCMAVTGAREWWIGALLLGAHEFVVYRVEHDPAITERMALQAWLWWHTYVLTDTPPPVDGSTATEAALRAAYPTDVPGTEVYCRDADALLDRRKALKERIKALEGDLRLVENTIKAATGDAEYLVDADGRRVFRWEPRNRVIADMTVVRRDFPEALVVSSARYMKDLRK